MFASFRYIKKQSARVTCCFSGQYRPKGSLGCAWNHAGYYIIAVHCEHRLLGYTQWQCSISSSDGCSPVCAATGHDSHNDSGSSHRSCTHGSCRHKAQQHIPIDWSDLCHRSDYMCSGIRFICRTKSSQSRSSGGTLDFWCLSTFTPPGMPYSIMYAYLRPFSCLKCHSVYSSDKFQLL